MAADGQGMAASASLEDLEARLAEQVGSRRPTPELWQPPDRGDVGLSIDRDGTWHYQGSPILRTCLVKLFASVLLRNSDGSYSLVTPAERVHVAVADAPFLAVEMAERETDGVRELLFRTNVDDVVIAGPNHPLRFDGDPAADNCIPYVTVRNGLEARLTRPVFYRLAELLTVDGSGEDAMLGVLSAGAFFPAAPHAVVADD